MREDFMRKLQSDQIVGFSDYFDLVNKRGAGMSVMVAADAQMLKSIATIHDQSKVKTFDPLPPLIDTVRAYVAEHRADEVDLVAADIGDVVNYFGGYGSIYYGILRTLVFKLLKGPRDSKSRCVILHGVTSSGKSTIAKFLCDIFICYEHRHHQGIFDAQITP